MKQLGDPEFYIGDGIHCNLQCPLAMERLGLSIKACYVFSILFCLCVHVVGQSTVPGNLVRLSGFRDPGTHMRTHRYLPAPYLIPGLEHMTTLPDRDVTNGHISQNSILHAYVVSR